MFSVGAHVHVSPACDSDHYIPPVQGNFCFRRSLLPRCPCFQCLHSFIQCESRSFIGRRKCVVYYTNTSPPFIPPWSSCCPLRGSLVPHRTLQPRCPCFTRFLHCVLWHETWSYTGRRRLCCVHTNTSSPFTTLVKMPSLQGSLVPRCTLQLRCPCFLRLYTMSYGVKLTRGTVRQLSLSLSPSGIFSSPFSVAFPLGKAAVLFLFPTWDSSSCLARSLLRCSNCYISRSHFF